MPLRSVIDIDVNDDRFRAFHEAFQKYRDAVDKMPAAWKAVGAAVQGTSVTMEGLAALLLAQNEHLVAALIAQRAFGRATQNSAHHMGTLARAASTVSQHIGAATRDLLKWGGISAGLIGAGGLIGLLYGVEHLASTATAGRRQARGLGLPYGMAQAFGTDYAPFLNDPEQLLQGMATARTDPTSDQFRAMMMLGFAPGANVNPGDVVDRIAAWARRTPTQLLGPLSQSMGIGSLADQQTLLGLQSLNPAELTEARDHLRTTFEQAKVSQDLLKKWQDLEVTLGESRLKIQSAFIDGLTPITPKLKELNTAFSDAVAAFLKSDALKGAIDAAILALRGFTAALNVTTGVGDINRSEATTQPTDETARRIWRMKHGNAPIPPSGPSGDPGLPPGLRDLLPSWLGGSSGDTGYRKNVDAAVGALKAKGWSDAAVSAALAAAMGEGGFAESFKKSTVDPASYGPWQFNFKGGEGVRYSQWLLGHAGENPKAISTQAEFLADRMEQIYPGFSRITDPSKATSIIEKYFERHAGELGRYNNNIGRAIEMVEKRHQQVGMNGSGGVRIIVENRTGGSAHVSAAMLGQVA